MPTVLSFYEAYENRSCAEDDLGRRQLKRIFRIQYDTQNVGYSYVLYADGIPLRFAAYAGPYESDVGCRAVRRSAVQDATDPLWWTVVVEYDSISRNPELSQSGSGQPSQPVNENPLLDPPDIQWGAILDKQVVEKTIDDPALAILNSAQQPFQPRPMIDDHRQTIIYSKNVANSAYEPAVLRSYWDHVNLTAFAGFSAFQVKLGYTTAHLQFRNHIPFWRVTYYFETRLPDWQLRILDKGTRVRKAGVSPPEFISLTQAGIPHGEVNLNGAGYKLAQSVSGTLEPPVFLRFDVYEKLEFSLLGLTGL